MTRGELEAIADRINTGTENPDTSRALIVFNLTDKRINGIAVFHASMSWPLGLPLPPILVTDIDGNFVPAALRDLTEAPDAKGRTDRSQLSFTLHFAVSEVPANGWRTYIASYADVSSPPLQDIIGTPGLVVMETTRHGGDLPCVGDCFS